MYRPGVKQFKRHQIYCEDHREYMKTHFKMSVCADKLDEFLGIWVEAAEGRTTSLYVYPFTNPYISLTMTLCDTDSLKKETGYAISRLRTLRFKRELKDGQPKAPVISEALGTLEFYMLWPIGRKEIRVEVTLDTGNSQVCRWEGTGEFDVIPESRVERTRMVCDENAALLT